MMICSIGQALEFAAASHWGVFEATVIQQEQNTAPHLNMFLEKSVIEIWANHIGYKVIEFIDGIAKEFDGHALGQSIVILEK